MAQIVGLDKAERVFKRMSGAMQRSLVAGLNQGGDELADAARILAPKENHDLAESIDKKLTVRRGGRSLTMTVYAGDTPETAISAFRQEFGRAPGGDGMEGHPGHVAQPFFFTAYAALRRRIRSRIGRILGKAAREAARRG